MNSVWVHQDCGDADHNMGVFNCNPSVRAKSLHRPSAPHINHHIEISFYLRSNVFIKNSPVFDIANYAYFPLSDIPI